MKIRCKSIYTENECVDGILEFSNGCFTSIIKDVSDEEEDVIDASGYRILPGIIDLHTHGFKGCNAQAVDKQELMELKKVMAQEGVTGFLPTAGEHFADEFLNLSLLADVIDSQKQGDGARMLGIHMEGPFLNPDRRGAFTLSQLLPCSMSKVQEYQKAARNHIVYMSLAPELDPDGEMIQYLKEQGILVAGGHTTATYEQFNKGISYGIQAATHTGNGMSQIDRREVGALGAALLSKQLYCEIICDFHHIAKEMLTLMFRIKPDHWIMISDSGQLSGNPPGVYEKYGQKRIIDENGILHLADGTIAGSSHSILYGMKNLEQQLSKSMEEIILMTSRNPAKLLGIDHQKGSIAIGKDADFIILDDQYQVCATFVEGVCVYQKRS